MTEGDRTVFIVDDDAGVRDSLALLLSLRGYRTVVFASAEDFLATQRPNWRGCLLVDLRMGGMSGLELQQRLRAEGIALPLVMITAHGDASSARAALKAEAVDFLEKPIDEGQLIAALEEAFAREARRASLLDAGRGWAALVARLTPREREVMELVARGLHNREIGARLGISPRTVEVYKSRLMDKLNIRTLPELIRIALQAENEAPQARCCSAPRPLE
ncbi:MAG: response regulator [Pseudomonadota bacterium]|jgi:FixJ family two-component response regulator